ncbi:hypothetical protein [Bhargavaea beijingensis]|uniref:Uncharacterized protein n=1 Tax=Bhargavaea beijingensis TaxID=426756 RepID=A0ABX9ZB00_9BACL|nr:hypothetical protein [Bhargavaea beijingensis]MCW1929338.1 hypothetical protein [Bhargavaea beijingensis]RSK29722.1 hypothetical protein EJA12_10950 [Bhargavaea beijingensis]
MAHAIDKNLLDHRNMATQAELQSAVSSFTRPVSAFADGTGQSTHPSGKRRREMLIFRDANKTRSANGTGFEAIDFNILPNTGWYV